MSSATVGREREHFVSTFLGAALPQPFRIGTGDIIDSDDRHTGQLDGVIEYPFMPSLPLSVGGPRLYLAEGVGAVLEVKSSLDTQWKEVQETGAKLKPLRRKFGAGLIMGPGPLEDIPLIAVGYGGWRTIETIEQKVSEGPADAILVIEHGLCATRGAKAGGDASMLLFLEIVHAALSSLKAAGTSLIPYARP